MQQVVFLHPYLLLPHCKDYGMTAPDALNDKSGRVVVLITPSHPGQYIEYMLFRSFPVQSRFVSLPRTTFQGSFVRTSVGLPLLGTKLAMDEPVKQPVEVSSNIILSCSV